jgi:rhodanese-related sulfurtransferase
MTNSITIQELNILLTGKTAPALLDVRRKSDYDATPIRIAGATWYDPEKIDDWLKCLPAGRTTVVYCVRGGSVSQSVAERLRKEGRDVRFLEGGLKAWTESGQLVEDMSGMKNG